MHAIGEIEDIDGGSEAKLVGLGVRSTDDFLARAATPAGRSGLAAAVGVTDAVVLKWANCADLMRVDGIGMQFADLLEEAGVDTIPELAQRNAHNLHERVVAVNTERSLAGRAPAEHEVESWIAQAKALPRILEYGAVASAGSTTSAAPLAPVPDSPTAWSSTEAAPAMASSGFEPAAATVSAAADRATEPASSTSYSGSSGGEDAHGAAPHVAASDEPEEQKEDAASTTPGSFSSASSATAQPTSWFARLLNRLRGSG